MLSQKKSNLNLSNMYKRYIQLKKRYYISSIPNVQIISIVITTIARNISRDYVRDPYWCTIKPVTNPMLATTQLTIRGLRVYHVTRYLSRNYILPKRCCPPTDPYTYTRVARTKSTNHVEADRILFPFLSSFHVREIGTKDRGEKAAERARRHRSSPYTSDRGACAPARPPLLCG